MLYLMYKWDLRSMCYNSTKLYEQAKLSFENLKNFSSFD